MTVVNKGTLSQEDTEELHQVFIERIEKDWEELRKLEEEKHPHFIGGAGCCP